MNSDFLDFEVRWRFNEKYNCIIDNEKNISIQREVWPILRHVYFCLILFGSENSNFMFASLFCYRNDLIIPFLLLFVTKQFTLQKCKNIRFKNNSTWIYYYDFNSANKVYTFKSTTSTCAYFTLTYNRHSHNLEWLNKKFYSVQGFATCFEI